jgi:hypothetical protein
MYRAFGLVIASNLPLPELEAADPRSASQVQIRLQKIDRSPPHPDRSIYDYGETEQFLHWPTVGSFLIRGANEILIDAAPEASEGLLRLPLLGPVMALLLHGRGNLVLHSSAVSIGGRVVAFVGDKGAGKSTTTAAAVEKGHSLFTDDLLAVSFAGPRPVAAPGFPSVKLVSDCADLFSLQGAQGLAAPVENFPKQLRRLNSGFANEVSEVATIYVLERGDRAEVVPYERGEALNAVMRFAYVPLFDGKPWDAQETRRHLSQCAALASTVRIARLITPSDLGRLGEIITCVENDLSRVPAGGQQPASGGPA